MFSCIVLHTSIIIKKDKCLKQENIENDSKGEHGDLPNLPPPTGYDPKGKHGDPY